jgi:hypothetical protein
MRKQMVTDITPLVSWKTCGPTQDPKSILRGNVALFGLRFLATALGVELYDIPCPVSGTVRGHGQRGTTSLADIELIKWQRAAEASGCYDTIHIEGRPYVVFLRPMTR